MGNEKEMINHPEHYNVPGRKECIVEMIDKYGVDAVINFCRLNSFKYRYRADYKENREQDIKKAEWYESKGDELIEQYGEDDTVRHLKDKIEELEDTIKDKDYEIECLENELSDFKEQICDLMEELEGD